MNSIKERRWKCRATGKVGFSTLIEAQWVVLHFKLKSRVMSKTDGRRIKHRMGKGASKRAYYCTFCEGYHLTKWDKGHFNNYNAKSGP